MAGYDQRGKNGDELGLFDLIQVLLGGVISKFHHRSSPVHFHPRPLPFEPLSTTFDHILRLNALLSTRMLKAVSEWCVSIVKPQQIADYCLGDHYEWCLESRFRPA